MRAMCNVQRAMCSMQPLYVYAGVWALTSFSCYGSGSILSACHVGAKFDINYCRN